MSLRFIVSTPRLFGCFDPVDVDAAAVVEGDLGDLGAVAEEAAAGDAAGAALQLHENLPAFEAGDADPCPAARTVITTPGSLSAR
jgi:hypothetical protein